jgi:hypothetical protein
MSDSGAKGKPKKKLPRKHGTRAKYIKEKCHCPRCREANNDYLAKRRSKKRADAAKVPTGSNLTTAQKSIRDSLIVSRRNQGWSFEKIGKEVKLGVRATEMAYERKLASMESVLEVDARKIVERLITEIQFSVGDLEQIALAAIEAGNTASAVSAKRAANEARERLQNLLQTTGVLPHDLGTIKHQLEFRVVVVEIVKLVHTFVGEIEAIALPEDKRPEVLKAAGKLTTGLEQLDEQPSANGGDDGTAEKETAATAS